ncbi:Polyadenylate-binding protein 1-like [Camellia lanceoleosa]|uniref:Polyadenylate-binding protein 1-like n=1 Tax=Camellia lanceoleosa TaxID=1840588 RepID=A0ACC0F974_9ERIC|nr:Polyadenylate-binding protein 1-like [Camellia lanceoleosa]
MEDEWKVVRRHRRTNLASNGIRTLPMVTMFVDNLPDSMDKEWLLQLCSAAGKVQDVFISKKLSKRSKRRFGFVRFRSKEEADRAVEAVNGVTVRDCRLFAKMAAFCKEGQGLREVVKSNGTGRIRNDDPYGAYRGTIGQSQGRNVSYQTFADVVTGCNKDCHKALSPSVKADEYGNEWLRRSVVGKTYTFCSVKAVEDILKNVGVLNLQVREIGGKSMRHELGRLVWLNCYGVPINFWNAITFSNIGKAWGEIVQLEDETLKGMSFVVGRVLIFTKCFEMINQTMTVEFKGISYPIRVIEEVVGRNFCSSSNIDPSSSSIIPESVAGSKQEDERQNEVGEVEGDLEPEAELDPRVDGDMEGDLVTTAELVTRHQSVGGDEGGPIEAGKLVVGETNLDLGKEKQQMVALEVEQLSMRIATAQKVVEEVNCLEGLKDGMDLICSAHLGSKNWPLVPLDSCMGLGPNCSSLPNQSSPEEIESHSEELPKILGS